MVLSLIRNTTRLFFFGVALLVGIQVPAFMGEYQTRVDAHFQEVSINIAGFQRTADAEFGGDLDALVTYYRESTDRVFRSDADSLQTIVDRYRRFYAEQQVMQGNSLLAVWHVLSGADQELMTETRSQYTYTVPLDSIAIQWGAAFALLVVVFGELCLIGCVKCSHLIGRKKTPKPI